MYVFKTFEKLFNSAVIVEISFKLVDYHMRVILTRGLYILDPLFEGKKHFLRSFFVKFMCS